MSQHLYNNTGNPKFDVYPFPAVEQADGSFEERKSGNIVNGGGIRTYSAYVTRSSEGSKGNNSILQSISSFISLNNIDIVTNAENRGCCLLAIPEISKFGRQLFDSANGKVYTTPSDVLTYDTYTYVLLTNNSTLTPMKGTVSYFTKKTNRSTIDYEKKDITSDVQIHKTEEDKIIEYETKYYNGNIGGINQLLTILSDKGYFLTYDYRENRTPVNYPNTTYTEYNDRIEYRTTYDRWEQYYIEKAKQDVAKYWGDITREPIVQFLGNLAKNELNNWGGTDPVVYKKIQTTFPIFSLEQIEDIVKYFNNGNYDNALNKDEIDLMSLDWSTDWTLYVDGKQPILKLVWKSDALEEYLDSDKNTSNITLDSIKVEISQNDINGKRVILDYVPYTSGNYKTNYARLAEKFDMTEWDKFLSNIIGSQTGIGDIPIYFKIYYGKLYSTLCYCKVPYSTEPTDYGKLPSIEIQDNSTVTVVYGSDGSGDDGYKRPTEKDDLPEGGTGGVNGGADVSGIFSRTYLMTKERIGQLSAFLWGDNFFQNIKLLNNSPIENIVACKLMPCTVSGTDEPITLGNVETGVNGDKTSSSLRVEIGSLVIPEYYHSFLDYAPYTKLTIFLPFIGFKEIDTNLFMGKTLTVYYIFDFITGAVKAQLYANNIYAYTFDAIGGIDIPITASNRAKVESGYITSALTVGAGVATGNALAVGGGILSLATPQYHYNTSGAFSPSCGFHDTRLVYVIYDRPIVQYPSGYEHNIGKPCKLSQNFTSLNGFTIVENGVEISSVPCNAREREEILQLLSTGVYM